MAAEARRRTAIASSTYEAGRPIFFGNPKLPLDTKVAIFKSTVDPVYFNLGLWTCQGPAWTALSEGYSRLLRRLVIARWGGDQAFHIPLPAVHLTLMAPPLEHLARRARLSLLCSITKAGPDELWAILQQEQTWFEAMKEDLHWLVADNADKWPGLQAVHWPEWCALFRQSTPWLKRQVRRRLQDSFKEYHDKHTVQLTLWALFHRAQASLPTRSRIGAEWCCRFCGDTSKAGWSWSTPLQDTPKAGFLSRPCHRNSMQGLRQGVLEYQSPPPTSAGCPSLCGHPEIKRNPQRAVASWHWQPGMAEDRAGNGQTCSIHSSARDC